MFEGAEKTIELYFCPQEYNSVSGGCSAGLRSLPVHVWHNVCHAASCNIISSKHNSELDAYILSESSLFVYHDKIILKTCGTTVPLLILPVIFESVCEPLQLKISFVLYRHRDFLNPNDQNPIHQAFQNEEDFLNKYFDGEGYQIGACKGDIWFLYIADFVGPQEKKSEERSLEIMMRGCNADTMQHFFNDGPEPKDPAEVSQLLGICDLLPNSDIDEFLFEPCGYSMNGLLGKSYWTIHVTPQEECSYVSFETNFYEKDCTRLVERVLNLFKPSSAMVTIMTDINSYRANEDPFQFQSLEGFRLKNKFYSTFEGDLHCWFCRYRQCNSGPAARDDRGAVDERAMAAVNTINCVVGG
eukprot:Filipodium_phascolosomae@DN1980_c0_g1_i1.p1